MAVFIVYRHYDNSGLVAARGIEVIAEFPPLVNCSIWTESRIPYSISRFTLGNFRNHFSRLWLVFIWVILSALLLCIYFIYA